MYTKNISDKEKEQSSSRKPLDLEEIELKAFKGVMQGLQASGEVSELTTDDLKSLVRRFGFSALLEMKEDLNPARLTDDILIVGLKNERFGQLEDLFPQLIQAQLITKKAITENFLLELCAWQERNNRFTGYAWIQHDNKHCDTVVIQLTEAGLIDSKSITPTVFEYFITKDDGGWLAPVIRAGLVKEGMFTVELIKQHATIRYQTPSEGYGWTQENYAYNKEIIPELFERNLINDSMFKDMFKNRNSLYYFIAADSFRKYTIPYLLQKKIMTIEDLAEFVKDPEQAHVGDKAKGVYNDIYLPYLKGTGLLNKKTIKRLQENQQRELRGPDWQSDPSGTYYDANDDGI
jgi:hypothetical protein